MLNFRFTDMPWLKTKVSIIKNNIAVNAQIEKSFVGIFKYVYMNQKEGTLATEHAISCLKVFLNFVQSP